MDIRKKTWPEYFEAILSGEKKFDMRLNDFSVRKGDILVLEEYDPQKNIYTGREIKKKVTRVDKFRIDDFGQKREIMEKGIQIISIE